jgi:hypothetical protein
MIDGAYANVLWAAGAVAAYAVLCRGLFQATEPARQSLVDLAGSLIDSPSVSDKDKRQIYSMLDDVHSWRSAWKLAFVALLIAFQSPFVSRTPECAPLARIPANMRETFHRFIRNWIVATLGNSFAACVLFSIGMFVAIAVSASLEAFLRALLPRSVDGGRDNTRAHA